MGDVRERVTGINRKRGEHGEDLLSENRVQLSELFLADLILAHQRDARLRERRQDLAVVDRCLAIDQSFDPRADRLQLFERGHSVRRGDGDRGQDLLFQTRDSDLEKVVQVLAEDGQEAHALE